VFGRNEFQKKRFPGTNFFERHFERIPLYKKKERENEGGLFVKEK